MREIKHIPLILFSIAVLKIIYTGASFSDAAMLLVLGAVAAFFEYKSSDAKIEALKKVQEKQAEVALAQAKALDEIRSSMSSMKLAQGVRTTNVGRI